MFSKQRNHIFNFLRGVEKFNSEVYKKEINFEERYISTAWLMIGDNLNFRPSATI